METVCEPAVLVAAAEAGPRGRILTFLTRGRGAVRVFARRQARRGEPRTWLEPLQGGELTFTLGADAAPGRLVAFVPQRVWPGIRGDFDRIVQALAFLETLTVCATEGEPQPELFALLVAFLGRLEGEPRPEAARALATARLLRAAGFAPRLDACVACRAPVAAGTAVAVDLEAGGAVCAPCLPGAPRRTSLPLLSAGAHGLVARALAVPSDAQAWRIRSSPDVTAEALALLESFVEARVGTRPRSHEFLAKLRRSRSPAAQARATRPRRRAPGGTPCSRT